MPLPHRWEHNISQGGLVSIPMVCGDKPLLYGFKLEDNWRHWRFAEMIEQPTNFMVFPRSSRCLMVSAAEKSWTRGSPPNEQFQVWDTNELVGWSWHCGFGMLIWNWWKTMCVSHFKIFQEFRNSNRITTPCSSMFFVCEGRYNLPSEYIRNSVLVLLSSQAVVRQNTVHTSSYAARFEVQLGLGLGIGNRKQTKQWKRSINSASVQKSWWK